MEQKSLFRRSALKVSPQRRQRNMRPSARLVGDRKSNGGGVGAALALPHADTEAMQFHLDEISRHVAKGTHAVLLLDRAGWHTTSNLDVPANITPILLPSRAPELNPVESVWRYLRSNWLSNRIFDAYDAIIDAAREAWMKLIARPETITSIGMREWATSVNRCDRRYYWREREGSFPFSPFSSVRVREWVAPIRTGRRPWRLRSRAWEPSPLRPRLRTPESPRS
jgi:transposase